MLNSTPKFDISDGEIARILAALRVGIDPGKLTHELTSKHPGNPGAARRLVDVALACLWLYEGAPDGDVLTMLESRHRFELSSATCRTYAVEILWSAELHMRAIEEHPNTTPKEHEYAAA